MISIMGLCGILIFGAISTKKMFLTVEKEEYWHSASMYKNYNTLKSKVSVYKIHKRTERSIITKHNKK